MLNGRLLATNLDSAYGVILSTGLAFLLVFRMNRVAIRWWDTRRMWGIIVEDVRVLVSGALAHMDHAPENRDQAIRWIGAFVICVKQNIRDRIGEISDDELAGFLATEDISPLRQSAHPGLYAASEIRHEMKLAFHVCPETSAAMGAALSAERILLEQTLNRMIGNMGGLERVKATPLPIVYVAHLRTFLLFYLLSIPLLYGDSWGWGTIPAVAVIAYALLGIDGAASECECPFDRTRGNHLDMDTYCLVAMDNILQLVVHAAEMKLRRNGDTKINRSVCQEKAEQVVKESDEPELPYVKFNIGADSTV